MNNKKLPSEFHQLSQLAQGRTENNIRYNGLNPIPTGGFLA